MDKIELFQNLEFALALKFMASILFVFFAILFLQSGLDKAFDWNSNYSWLKGHFSKSPLAGKVPWLLSILMSMELTSGTGSFVCAVYVWIGGISGNYLLFFFMCWNVFTLLALFFGQRMAKDYLGASGIVPYFITAFLGLFFLLITMI
jgi:hypothetical protein